MENQLRYRFDDEIVSRFSYDMNNNTIEICFDSYYDGDKYIDEQGILIIEGWEDAKSKGEIWKFL